MVKRKDIIDVIHIILLVVGVLVVAQAYFSFIHDHVYCDYSEVTYSRFNYTGNNTITDVSLSKIKYAFATNVTGVFNQNIILEDGNQFITNCKFKLLK